MSITGGVLRVRVVDLLKLRTRASRGLGHEGWHLTGRFLIVVLPKLHVGHHALLTRR